MKSSNSPIEHLKLMISLEEKRAGLQDELGTLESQLDELKKQLVSGGTSSFSPSPSKAFVAKTSSTKAAAKPAKGKKAPHGALRDQVFAALDKAGAAGVKVLDLARELGTNPANIYAWFHAAVKRYPSIKKAGAATYRLAGKLPKTEAPKAAAAPISSKPKATAVKAKAAPSASKAAKGGKGGNRRGALQARILDALQSAGSKGVTIKDLSEKFKMPYRNVQVWFATTGKKNPSVKKVGPATYQYAG